MQICLLPTGAKIKPLFSLTLYLIEVSNMISTASLGCFQFSQGLPLEKLLYSIAFMEEVLTNNNKQNPSYDLQD